MVPSRPSVDHDVEVGGVEIGAACARAGSAPRCRRRPQARGCLRDHCAACRGWVRHQGRRDGLGATLTARLPRAAPRRRGGRRRSPARWRRERHEDSTLFRRNPFNGDAITSPRKGPRRGDRRTAWSTARWHRGDRSTSVFFFLFLPPCRCEPRPSRTAASPAHESPSALVRAPARLNGQQEMNERSATVRSTEPPRSSGQKTQKKRCTLVAPARSPRGSSPATGELTRPTRPSTCNHPRLEQAVDNRTHRSAAPRRGARRPRSQVEPVEARRPRSHRRGRRSGAGPR